MDKLKAWVSGEAGEYDWDEAHAKYLSFLTPGPFQRAVAGGDVELVEAVGGFQAYEKAHAKALAATLAKKFPAHIPEEIFPRVVAFWAHAGFYASAAAVAALAAETNPRTNQGNLLRNLCGAIGV